MPYINSFGFEEQKQKWLPRSTTGEMISSIAMTEPATGSDLAAVKTTAVRVGDHYIINGEIPISSIYAGTNEIIRVIIAKNMGL